MFCEFLRVCGFVFFLGFGALHCLFLMPVLVTAGFVFLWVGAICEIDVLVFFEDFLGNFEVCLFWVLVFIVFLLLGFSFGFGFWCFVCFVFSSHFGAFGFVSFVGWVCYLCYLQVLFCVWVGVICGIVDFSVLGVLGFGVLGFWFGVWVSCCLNFSCFGF